MNKFCSNVVFNQSIQRLLKNKILTQRIEKLAASIRKLKTFLITRTKNFAGEDYKKTFDRFSLSAIFALRFSFRSCYTY